MWTGLFVFLGFVLGIVLTVIIEIKVVKGAGGMSALGLILTVLITTFVCIGLVIGQSMDGVNPAGSGSYSADSSTCQSCGRSFSDYTEKNYIWHTNMCKNCYRNFCYATGRTPHNYDK